MQQDYDIVFTGRLRPGAKPDDVLDSLAKHFKIGPDTARAMLRAEQEIAIRRSVPSQQAYRIKEVLESCGLVVRLDALHDLADGEEPSLELVPKGGAAEAEKSPPDAAQHLHRTGVQCPKCGTRQPQAEACVQCGLIFAKYYQQAANPTAGEQNPKISAARAAARKTVARRRNSVLMNVALAIAVLCIVGGLGYVYYSGYQF